MLSSRCAPLARGSKHYVIIKHNYVHMHVCTQMVLHKHIHIRITTQAYLYILVSWCVGELWVDQRKKCADIRDVAQVTDIRTLPN